MCLYFRANFNKFTRGHMKVITHISRPIHYQVHWGKRNKYRYNASLLTNFTCKRHEASILLPTPFHSIQDIPVIAKGTRAICYAYSRPGTDSSQSPLCWITLLALWQPHLEPRNIPFHLWHSHSSPAMSMLTSGPARIINRYLFVLQLINVLTSRYCSPSFSISYVRVFYG